MTYKPFFLKLLFRLLSIVTVLFFAIHFLTSKHYVYTGLLILVAGYFSINTYFFLKKRFQIMDDFFEAVKYRDFSRWYPEDSGSSEIQSLYKGFNAINKTIQDINITTEAQYVYLQKILEMVNVGIITYNLETGNVIWANDSFRNLLNFPSFKNMSFVQNRKPELYNTIFDTYNPIAKAISITTKTESLKVLLSDTVFKIKDQTVKLVVIQNIDSTLDENESEAWKKLLSVMTHEIMNSIAPISSLAETLQSQVETRLKHPKSPPLNLDDLNSGIKTIKKRSEGLLRFAKTYRSLNKVTHLNVKNIAVSELLLSIKSLMAPSVSNKNINLIFEVSPKVNTILIDSYLIEQVLINLLLNAIDACSHVKYPEIKLIAHFDQNKQTTISIIDNGKGIPDEILDKIFIPFFSTKKTGSGIGLSLCKQIMLLHKGKIQVKSSLGAGTVFKLFFK